MQELEALLNRPERYGHLASRNKVLMGLLIYQALYPVEMEALRAGDINLEAGTMRIRATAKTNDRELTLKPKPDPIVATTYIREVRPRLLKEGTSDRLLIGQRGEPMSAEDITKQVKRSFARDYTLAGP